MMTTDASNGRMAPSRHVFSVLKLSNTFARKQHLTHGSRLDRSVETSSPPFFGETMNEHILYLVRFPFGSKKIMSTLIPSTAGWLSCSFSKQSGLIIPNRPGMMAARGMILKSTVLARSETQSIVLSVGTA
jgi:hypothetical protein